MTSLLFISPGGLLTLIFSLETVYVLTGLILLTFAALTFVDRSNPRRVGSGCFWLVLGAIFLLGSLMPSWLTGLLVLLMVGLDGAGQVGRGRRPDEDAASSKTGKTDETNETGRRLGDRLFIPVLAIPVVTFAFALVFRWLGQDVNRGALVGLGFGAVAALIIGLRITGGTIRMAMTEGRRLNETMGTVNILPQLLASLGVIFTAAKVGDLIAFGIKGIVPEGNLFLLVVANCLGMALFTLVIGNSFAAFPVIATGVLVPLIIRPFGV
ncbi:MAG TPA: DUF979 family protein, partial [Blastocatellia bacterium]|nr:DUF979 family protein [Blastocatellia bacterium]